MAEVIPAYKWFILALAAPAIYWVMVLSGRQLKRRQLVPLGLLYHLFALGVAVYVPAASLDFQWPFLRHLAAAVVVLGAIFLVTLVERYIWELYFKERHGVKVPKFLTEVVRFVI